MIEDRLIAVCYFLLGVLTYIIVCAIRTAIDEKREAKLRKEERFSILEARLDELGGCVIDDARAIKKLDLDLHSHIISIMGQIEEMKKASKKAKKGGGK